MEITIENTQLAKQTTLEVPDDFYTSADDLLVHLGLDRYKLVTTKTQEQIRREELAIDFGEEVYPTLFAKYPDYGMESSEVSIDIIKSVISAKLEDEQYAELKNDQQPDTLLNCLVTAFTHFCTVQRKLQEQDNAIAASQLHDTVFFDYILRYKKIFQEAKTLKDIDTQVATVHEYSKIDKRKLYGYPVIFTCLKPYLQLINELVQELTTGDTKVELSTHKLYTDEQYLADNRQVTKTVVDNLSALHAKYEQNDNIGEDTYAGTTYDITKYGYVIELMNAYTKFFDLEAILRLAIMNKHQDAKIDITAEVTAFSEGYTSLITQMADLEIRANNNPQLGIEGLSRLLDANLYVVLFVWRERINNDKQGNAPIQMCTDLRTHLGILQRVLIGELDVMKLLNGEYTQEVLVNTTSSEQ